METVVYVMMGLVCFNYLLKQSNRPLYAVAISAVVCAVFVYALWPYAIEQSKSQVQAWLGDTALMLDLSIVLWLEVALQLAYCLLSARIQTSGLLPARWLFLYRSLRWFPGVLVFPILYSLLVVTLFAWPGQPFARVAGTLAVGVLLVIPLGSWALRRVLPEKDIRLELLFLLNALVGLLGLVATVNGRTAVEGLSEVNGLSLAGVVGLTLLGGAVGWLGYRWRLQRRIRRFPTG